MKLAKTVIFVLYNTADKGNKRRLCVCSFLRTELIERSHVCVNHSLYIQREMLYVYMLHYAGYSIQYFGAGVRQGMKGNSQRDDLIQANREAEGIGFHLREAKKRILNMDLKKARIT